MFNLFILFKTQQLLFTFLWATPKSLMFFTGILAAGFGLGVASSGNTPKLQHRYTEQPCICYSKYALTPNCFRYKVFVMFLVNTHIYWTKKTVKRHIYCNIYNRKTSPKTYAKKNVTNEGKVITQVWSKNINCYSSWAIYFFGVYIL